MYIYIFSDVFTITHNHSYRQPWLVKYYMYDNIIKSDNANQFKKGFLLIFFSSIGLGKHYCRWNIYMCLIKSHSAFKLILKWSKYQAFVLLSPLFLHFVEFKIIWSVSLWVKFLFCILLATIFQYSFNFACTNINVALFSLHIIHVNVCTWKVIPQILVKKQRLFAQVYTLYIYDV